MVMVHGPNGETAVPSSADPAAESPAPLAPAAPPEAESGSPVVPPPVGTADEAAGTRPQRTFKFREDYDPTAEPVAAKSPRGLHIPGPPKTAGPTATAPLLDGDAPPAPTGAAHQPDTARMVKQWLLLGSAAIAGVALALLLLAVVAWQFGSPPPSVAEAPLPDQPAQSTPAAPESPTDLTQPPADPTPSTEPADADDAAEPDQVATPDPVSPAEGTTGATPVPADGTSAEPPAAADTAPAPPETTSTESDLSGPSAPDADTPAAPDAVATADPPEEVALDGAAPTDASTGTTEPASADHASDPEPRPALPAGLTQVIPALEFHDKPLITFIDFVADFTALPVSLNVDAIRVSRIPLDTNLSCDQQQVTLDGVLQTVLEPVGLEYSVAEGSLVIAPQRDVEQEVEQVAYDVSDLADNDEQMQALAQLVLKLIVPAAWSDAGGDGTLVVDDQSLGIEQTAAGHFHVARFLDRLRLARGLLPRSELPDELLDLTPVFLQATGELGQPVSAHFPEPTEVARILEYFRTASRLHLIVDWPSTAPANWLPSTPSTLTSEDGQPLSKLLDTWLTPLQLNYRVIDSRTIQIASQPMLDSRPEVEIYPLKGITGQDATHLIQDLKTHLGAALFVDAGGNGDIVFDSASISLLVLLPQPQQRRAAEWLAAANQLRVTTSHQPEQGAAGP